MSRRAVLPMLFPALCAAQTLAHPGWRGNGITAERWWQHAAVVQLPAETTFVQALTALDTAGSAGADTVLLPDLQSEPGGTAPFADHFGSMDELDALLREASARRMHVLLTVPLLRLANSSGELRYWLARGVAGFSVGTLRPADVDTLHVLRAAVDRSLGQRLLLVSLQATTDLSMATRFAREFSPPTLRLAAQAEAMTLPPGFSAVTVADPAASPTLHGQLPVLPFSVLQAEGGTVALRQLLSRSRARQGSSPRRR